MHHKLYTIILLVNITITQTTKVSPQNFLRRFIVKSKIFTNFTSNTKNFLLKFNVNQKFLQKIQVNTMIILHIILVK